ncbi:zinc metallopeptidase [Gemella sp. zg-570]|uniref:zinc metallopeptidase n=1 Tax=Gemella sp. zg-570 TaxID=2840371 RepID=UPI00352D1763
MPNIYGFGMYGISGTYLLYFALLMIIPLWAQMKVKSTYSRYKTVKTLSGLTGKEVAEVILKANGITDVKVVRGEVELSDHYNPKENVVVLSPIVYSQPTVASVAIAAHEIGHVIQDKVADYKPMRLRHSFVPIANLGSNLSMILIMVGLGLTYFMTGGLGIYIAWIGVLFMLFAVLFQIVTLPVEFDASKRALEQVVDLGIVNSQEHRHCKKVLTAAALTYVAAAVVALMELMRFILIILNVNNNRS